MEQTNPRRATQTRQRPSRQLLHVWLAINEGRTLKKKQTRRKTEDSEPIGYDSVPHIGGLAHSG